MAATAHQLIINSPFEPPRGYWSYIREQQGLDVKGRHTGTDRFVWGAL